MTCLLFIYLFIYFQVNIITPLGKTLGWLEKGNIGNNWMKGCANLQDYQPTTVVFTGIRGNGPLGDIAIDDVMVKPGICYGELCIFIVE